MTPDEFRRMLEEANERHEPVPIDDLRAAADSWAASETRADGSVYLGKPAAFWYEVLSLVRTHDVEHPIEELVRKQAAIEALLVLLRETVDEPDVPYAMGADWITARDAALASRRTQ